MNETIFRLAVEGRLVLELLAQERLDTAVDLGLSAASEFAALRIRHPHAAVDGPVLVALATKKLRDGRLRARETAAALRIRWTRRGIAKATRCTMPLYLAGCAAWDVATSDSQRARNRFQTAARFAEARGLRGELDDVNAIARRLLA
jgi:hypothetical protein